MGTKYQNTKKKMAALGLKKTEGGEYTYIDPNDKNGEFKPVRKRNKDI